MIQARARLRQVPGQEPGQEPGHHQECAEADETEAAAQLAAASVPVDIR